MSDRGPSRPTGGQLNPGFLEYVRGRTGVPTEGRKAAALRAAMPSPGCASYAALCRQTEEPALLRLVPALPDVRIPIDRDLLGARPLPLEYQTKGGPAARLAYSSSDLPGRALNQIERDLWDRSEGVSVNEAVAGTYLEQVMLAAGNEAAILSESGTVSSEPAWIRQRLKLALGHVRYYRGALDRDQDLNVAAVEHYLVNRLAVAEESEDDPYPRDMEGDLLVSGADVAKRFADLRRRLPSYAAEPGKGALGMLVDAASFFALPGLGGFVPGLERIMDEMPSSPSMFVDEWARRGVEHGFKEQLLVRMANREPGAVEAAEASEMRLGDRPDSDYLLTPGKPLHEVRSGRLGDARGPERGEVGSGAVNIQDANLSFVVNGSWASPGDLVDLIHRSVRELGRNPTGARGAGGD